MKATPANRLLFQLVPSMPHTGETEYGLLPTVTTQEVEHPEMELTENGRRKTKDKRDSHSMNLAKRKKGNLEEILSKVLLPTPRSAVIEESYETTMARRKRSQNPKNNTKTKPDSISQYLEMLPIPKARDWKDTGNMDNNKRMDNLGVTVWHKSEKATGKKTGYRLQPAFVEWMMGFPLGWSDIESSD